MDVTVIPPNTTGGFLLELDLVRERTAWFSDLGSKSLRVPVLVERGQMCGFDNYSDPWEKANLQKDYWSVVGPASREEFEALGRHKRQLLVDLGLVPSSRVLDVGCGTGCLTEALEQFLDPSGLYFGTDIASQAVEFCQAKFTRPNFHFLVNGPTSVPVEGHRFDFVTLFSVFTHMYPDEIESMLRSVGALLAPEGQIIADAFVVSEGAEYCGDRSKVDINISVLYEAFERAGMAHEVYRELGKEGQVQRQLFRLRPKESGPAGR